MVKSNNSDLEIKKSTKETLKDDSKDFVFHSRGIFDGIKQDLFYNPKTGLYRKGNK